MDDACVDGTDAVAPTHLETLYAVRHPERIVVSTTPAGDDAPRHVAPHLAAESLRGRRGRLYPHPGLVLQLDTPFVEGLCGSEDTVLHGQLLSRFDLSASPSSEGLSASVPPTRRGPADAADAVDPDAAVRAHLLRSSPALAAGTQADPADRTPVTNALAAAEVADLPADDDLHPGGHAHVEAALRTPGIPGHHLAGTGTIASQRPADGFGLFHTPPSGARSLVVVAGSAGSVNEHARMLGFLARSGHHSAYRVLTYKGLTRAGAPHSRARRSRSAPPPSAGSRPGSPPVRPAAAGSRCGPRRRACASVGARSPSSCPPGWPHPPSAGSHPAAATLLAERGRGSSSTQAENGFGGLLRAWGDDSPTVARPSSPTSCCAPRAAASCAGRSPTRTPSRPRGCCAARPSAPAASSTPELDDGGLPAAARAVLEAAALLDDREALFGALAHPLIQALRRRPHRRRPVKPCDIAVDAPV